MRVHIVLDEDPTPAQVSKGLQVMLMLAGVPTMAAAIKTLHEVFEEDEDGDTTKSAAVAPPPPPPATVAAIPPAPMALVEGRDSSGLPWDARIHSSKKTVNKDGTWKARKNIDDATVAAVTAELRAIIATGGPAPQQVVPPPPATVAAIPPPPATVAAPPAPANAIPPTAAPAGDANTFVAVMQKISGGLSGGKLDQAKVAAALASVGLKQPLDLNTNPAQIPAVNAYLDAVMM